MNYLRVFGVAVLALVVLYHPGSAQAGRARRLCRYDKRSQQCVDIGSRGRPMAYKVSQRIDETGTPPTENENIEKRTQLPVATGNSSNAEIYAEHFSKSASGKCAAHEGVCDIRTTGEKTKCKCWNVSGTEVLSPNENEKLCRRRRESCQDVRIKKRKHRGKRKKKHRNRNCRNRHNGRKSRNERKGKRAKGRRALRSGQENTSGKLSWQQGRCAAKEGECVINQSFGRYTTGKCRCNIRKTV